MFKFVYLVELIIERRRFAIVGLISVVSLLFIALVAPVVQAQRPSIESRINGSSTNQARPEITESPDVVTNAFSQMSNDTGQAANSVEIMALSGILSTATTVTHVEYGVLDDVHTATVLTLHGTVDSVGFIAHTTEDSFDFTTRVINDTGTFFYHLTSIGSIIQPRDHIPVPVITKLEEQQAEIIQSNTKAVAIALANNSTGGACDNGNGNGYYPASWCNAPMDTIATIPYTSEPVNRECTSYAYWYFTSIEGHTNFQAWGNAKYWATTSNYPTHITPIVGAIAVETAGEYGHVAIVQALPGQEYGGQTVPTGYVLVSEMNYDWEGHFRYSYSPLTKFSAYIYP